MDNIKTCQMYILFQILFCSTEQCYFTSTKAFCKNGLVPGHLPENITEVHLEDVNLENFRINHDNDEFHNWANVKSLEIYFRKGKELYLDSLKGLNNLHYLGLHGDAYYYPNGAFRDLQNLVTLNISGNKFLGVTSLEKTFDFTGSHFIVPKLQTIIMTDLSAAHALPLKLENLFKAISKGRQIKYVDISGIYVENLDLKTFKPLCESGLQSLVIKRVSLTKICLPPDCLEDRNICSTLEYIDASRIKIPNFEIKFILILHKWFPDEGTIINNAKTLLFDEVLTFMVAIKEYLIFPLQRYATRLENLSFTKNNLNWLNFSVTIDTVRSVDVSQNILEYVHPKILSEHGKLQHINMSSNRLYFMQRYYPEDFIDLFKFHVSLKEINLSSNRLKNLPQLMFISNNNLSRLDLSCNMLTGITFEIGHLSALRIIVLKGNSIHTVSPETIGKLDHLFSNTGTLFDLSNNSFICSCKHENKATIQWLKMTKVIYINEPYSCVLQNTERKLDIFLSAIEETDRYCLALRQKRILSIMLPILFAVLASIMVIALYGWYQWRQKRVFQNVLRQLNAGIFPKEFLVFLSFCSDDTELVIDEVYPKLCESIQNFKQNNKSVVCLGDRYFRPGFPIIDEAADYINRSAVLLAIVSRAFCESIWCEHELNEAVHARIPVILLFTEHVDRQEMPSAVKRIFQSNVHASWVREDNGGHPVPEWKVLCKSIISLAANTKIKVNDVAEMEYEL